MTTANTTRSMNLNHKNCTIEMTKKFCTAASRFGTKEYNDLQQVRRDYPSYNVVTIAHKTTTTFKGLSYDYMEKYIAAHDDEEQSARQEYEALTGKSEDAENACAEAVSYAGVKDWFLDKYPEIEAFHEKRNQILADVAKRKEAKKTKKVA